ncbi:MAG: PQQ-binding-like beta-propeller repeat protein [Thermoplasmata archaeon]|uniref:PQQ-binding-like beta-propeller repeat protein n=1 Tax=Candidatus Sysuiplasma superficiale TaxID=2823368 RepID=A0A8J8CDE2_9ARCH|nr:PQQ-binding-like beta-propeller repeat protein [Candidatus Sysuiplasma superficiale]
MKGKISLLIAVIVVFGTIVPVAQFATARTLTFAPTAEQHGAGLIRTVPANATQYQMNSVLIYFQNGSYYWFYAPFGRYTNGFNLTFASTKYYNLGFNYTNFSFGTFVNMIGGIWNNNTTFNPSWSVLIWNVSQEEWAVSPVGIGSISMKGNISIALSYSYWNSNFSAPLVYPAPTPLDPYPNSEFRDSPSGTGVAGFHSNLPYSPPNSVLSWVGRINTTDFGGIDTQPVEYNGMIYLLSDGPSNGGRAGVFAYNGYGDVIWNSTVGSPGYELSSPLAANGMIVVSSSNGYVYSFNSNNGRLNYMINLHSQQGITSSPILGPQGFFVLNDSGGVFYIAFNGTEYWNFSIGYHSYYSSPVYYNGTLYVAADLSSGGVIAALSVPNATAHPRLLWERNVGGFIRDTPAVSNDLIYFSQAKSSGGSGTYQYIDVTLTVMNAFTGMFVRNYTIGGSNSFPSSPLIAGNEIILSDGSEIVSINGTASNSTSFILWSVGVVNSYGSPSASLFGRYILVSTDSAQSELYVLSERGVLVWNFTAKSPDSYSLSSPAYDGSTLLWGDDAGYLFSFSRIEIANFTYVQHNGTVSMTAVVNPAAAPVVNYTWNLGNGVVAYTQTVVHNYTENGTYPVSLSVVYSDGTIASYTGNVVVNSVIHIPSIITVKKARSQFNLFEYAAAGISVIIIAAAVTFVVLRNRKRRIK